MVSKPFGLVKDMGFQAIWSSIESRLTGSLTKGNQEQLSILGLVEGHRICRIWSSKG